MRITAFLLMLLALPVAAQQGNSAEDEKWENPTEDAEAGRTAILSMAAAQHDPQHLRNPSVQLREDQILYVRSWKPFDPSTMLVQAGCALVTETVAWFAGFYLVSSGGGTGDLGSSLGAMIFGGHLLASLAGAPAGVQLGGALIGGNGTFFGSLLGGVAGTVLSTVTLYALRGSSDPWLQAGAMYASYTIPAIVGYHLTASPMNVYFYDDAPEASARAERLSHTPAYTLHPDVPGPGYAVDPVHPLPDVQVTLLNISF